jgi:isoleucyl-tRNA synthetase
MVEGFKRVAPQVHFPTVEARILELWDELDAFQTSIDIRPADRSYTFYDGPPFPTGSPHYGNLLAGVIKDVVPRYWTMRGYRVQRRFGWDTHGLPIEMEVEKDLGVSGPRAINEFGIDKFNEACRMRVQANTETWEEITRRIGRWIDFENDYRTLDVDFMESVWWVFRALWDKGLIYKDFKVLPYSFGATTPLSNFEANMDYRDVDDPSITVRVRAIGDHGSVYEGDSFLIWTTTPWTLPANLAIAVGDDLAYVRVDADIDGAAGPFWLAADLVEAYWPEETPPILASVPGRELVGASYEPPFDYFGEERDRGAFRIISSTDVTTTEGTGLVHMAPAYGEADFYALQAAGLDVLHRPRGPLHRRRPGGGRRERKGRRCHADQAAQGKRLHRPPHPDPPLVPVLLAHRHSAHLQSHPHLVRGGRVVQRADGRAERNHPLGPGRHRLTPVRELAGRRKRLGDQPQPLLGKLHPGMGMRRL